MKELNELVRLANLANIAGHGTPQMADFRVTANPDTILAIAEAFRALEKEQCGGALLEREQHHVEVVGGLLKHIAELEQRAEAAEAIVSELKESLSLSGQVQQRLREDFQIAEEKLAELVPDDTKRMDWLVSKTVNVREPLPYGSHNIFWSQQTSDDCDENYTNDLREQIDAILRKIEEAK